MDLFLSEIIKPSEYLGYENRLAMSLKQLGEEYLETAVIKVGNAADYGSNTYLFNRKLFNVSTFVFMLRNFRYYCLDAKGFAPGGCGPETEFPKYILQSTTLHNGPHESRLEVHGIEFD